MRREVFGPVYWVKYYVGDGKYIHAKIFDALSLWNPQPVCLELSLNETADSPLPGMVPKFFPDYNQKLPEFVTNEAVVKNASELHYFVKEWSRMTNHIQVLKLKDFFEAVEALSDNKSPILALHSSKQMKKLIEHMWEELPPENQKEITIVGPRTKNQIELDYYLKVYAKTHQKDTTFEYDDFMAEVHNLSGGKASILQVGLMPHIQDYVTAKWNDMHQL